MKKIFFTMLFVLLSTITVYSAELPKPIPNTWIHDFAHVIPEDKLAELDAQAKSFKDVQCEVAVVTINSLEGEDSFEYSLRMAREWGIGSKDGDIRGFLILIAIKEHKTSIRTSRHIEGQLTDGFTGNVARQMNQLFKHNDFYGGFSLGLGKFKARLEEGDASPPPATISTESDVNWLLVFILFGIGGLGGLIAVIIYNRKKDREAEEDYERIRRENERTRELMSEVRNNYPHHKVIESSPRKTTGKYTGGSYTTTRKRKDEPKKRDSGSHSSYTPTPSYDYSSSSSSSSSSSDSSSSYDSGSSYSGGSDYGGGGSDSSW